MPPGHGAAPGIERDEAMKQETPLRRSRSFSGDHYSEVVGKKMGKIFALIIVFLPALSAYAVDDTACDLIAFGQIRLGEINDRINKDYSGKKGVFWNISGDAYHDFTKIPKTDVIIGLAGYLDIGLTYNNGRQLVKDAGSGFAYYHKDREAWKLIQVEMADGKKYKGFEGADLTGQGRDQLVVYSSSGTTQVADIYGMDNNGRFKKKASLLGFGKGPRVAEEFGKPILVDFQRATVNQDFPVYYGRPFRWNGHEFLGAKDVFLDRVQSYDPLHSTNDESSKDLEFFEDYLAGHPKDFCSLANCYDLSRRLDLGEKMNQYRKQLVSMKDDPLLCEYCGQWLDGRNQSFHQQYLEWIMGKRAGGKGE